MDSPPSSRREFVGFAGAAFVKPSVPAKSAARILGANDRINAGVIGAGAMGLAHIRSLTRNAAQLNIELRGISEIYQRYKERAKTLTGLDTKAAHQDYRDLIDRKDIDCVFIAAPDHWHAQMALDAMVSGKDVYVEPPVAMTLPQADDVYRAVRQFNRVLQLGCQAVSHPRYAKAREIIQKGGIGEVLWAQASANRNSRSGEWNAYMDEEATAQSVDWPRWLGAAQRRPFSAERFFRWRKYWDYSDGMASDMLSHKLAPLLTVTGQLYPVRVTGNGGIFTFPDREVPDTYSSVIEYPKFLVNLAASIGNASADKAMPEAIHGHGGSLLMESNKLTWLREPDGRSETFEYKVTTAELLRLHAQDFFMAMRGRVLPAAGTEIAHQTLVALSLGTSSYRTGELRNFDPVRKTVIWRGPARPGFEGRSGNFPGERPKQGEG